MNDFFSFSDQYKYFSFLLFKLPLLNISSIKINNRKALRIYVLGNDSNDFKKKRILLLKKYNSKRKQMLKRINAMLKHFFEGYSRNIFF